MTLIDYTFYLTTLSIIRFIGGIVFLDFYFKYKDRKFILITLAFALLAVSPAIQIFLPDTATMLLENSNQNIFSELLFILSEVMVTLCIFILIFILISYIRYVKKTVLVMGSSIIFLLPFILFPFIKFKGDFYFSQIIDLLLIVIAGIIIIINLKQFRVIAANVPIFFLVNIVVIFTNLSLGIIELRDVELEMITRIALSFITPFTFIHLEYNLLGNQKDKLKDNYSHNLSNILQIVSGRIYVISNAKNNEESENELNKLQSDVEDISDLINKIRKI